MHYAFSFLPLEVQTSIKELAALGTPESAIDLLIERTSKALEAKTTSLQLDIVRIEESLNTRVERIGEKLQADLRTQHGETNAMLLDVRNAQIAQEAAAHQLRADFQAFGETVSDRLTGVEDRMHASESDRRDIHTAIRDLNTRHGKQLAALHERLRAIEHQLESAGQHEAGRG
jgi:hypothetical protein